MSILIVASYACGGPGVRWDPPPEKEPPVTEMPPDTGQQEAGPPPVRVEPPEAPPEQPAEAVPPPPGVEEKMVHFAHAWLGLSEEARKQELQRSEEIYLEESSPANLVRYALLSTLKGSERPGATKRIRDDLRGYIDQHGATATPGEFIPLARLLLHILDQREEQLSKLTTRNETLQRQLDELKAIEEQLRERGGPQPIQTPQ